MANRPSGAVGVSFVVAGTSDPELLTVKAERLLRQVVVPGMHQQRQIWQAGEQAMQFVRLRRDSKSLGHHRGQRLAMLEILDVLRRAGEIGPHLVGYRRLGRQLRD